MANTSSGISRRQLIAATAAALAARPLGAFAAEAGATPDVIVIGAGLSGLNAALLLEELGVSVQVIESRDRIGGRLYTRYDLPGHPEVGGNTMASGYARMIDTANRLGIELIDYAPRMYGGAPPELIVDRQRFTREQWAASPLNPFPDGFRERMPWELLRARTAGTNPLKASADWLSADAAKLDVPLHTYLRDLGISDAEIRVGNDMLPYYGTSAWDVSALMYLFNDRWIAEQMQHGAGAFAAKGGNQRFAEAMAAALHREVALNEEVAMIEQDGNRVRVHCRGGHTFTAGHVICSLPFSKVRDIDLRPALADQQRQAVRTLSYMRNTLVFLVPTRPFWEDDGLSPSMWTNGTLGSVGAQRFGDDPSEVTGLVVNTRGWVADRLDRMGAAAAQAFCIAEIEKIRPAARGALEAGGFHSWWLDPHNAGDWAIFAPGQVSGLLPTMARPHGRIHFCGEHTATMNRGMEGAMESAERAVLELLERL